MIGIRVGDEFLDLPDNLEFEVVLNNPLFNEDNLSPGSGSYPFKIPGDDVSEKNARILGHPDVLEQPGGTRKIDGDLYIDGCDYKKGKIVVRDATAGYININLVFGLSNVSEDFKSKKIRDLANMDVTIGTTQVVKQIFLQAGNLATAPFMIKVNGRVYEGATLSALVQAINADTTEPSAFATLVTTGTTPLGLNAPFIAIRPFANETNMLSELHVEPVADNGNGSNGFVWRADTFNPVPYFTDFNNYFSTQPDPTGPLRWPFAFNQDMYGEETFMLPPVMGGTFAGGTSGTKRFGYINGRTSFGLIMNSPNAGMGVNVPFLVHNNNSLQPFVRVAWVLDRILQHYGLTLEGDWRDADVEEMLIDNAAPLDVPMNFLGRQKFVFWRRNFNVSSLLPDITVVDFLSALQSRYNLGVYINEKTGRLRIVRRENIARRYAHTDITAQAGRVETRTDLRTDGFILESKSVKEDTASRDERITVAGGEAVHEIKLPAITQSIVIENLMGVAVHLRLPFKNQKVSDSFPFRVFFENVHPAGWGETLENVPFRHGLYETFWQYWLHFESRRRSALLPVNFYLRDLRHFDWEMKRVLDRNYFLVKSIKAKVSASGVLPSQVELYTMF